MTPVVSSAPPTGLVSGRRARPRSMPSRGELELRIRFGPTTSPTYPVAVAYAGTHATSFKELDGSVEATFVLESEERAYGAALALVEIVGNWKATTIEVSGSPESRFRVMDMLICSREWLRGAGRCRDRTIPPEGAARCRCCPLFDPEWAAEANSGIGIALPTELLDSDPGLWTAIPGLADATFQSRRWRWLGWAAGALSRAWIRPVRAIEGCGKRLACRVEPTAVRSPTTTGSRSGARTT